LEKVEMYISKWTEMAQSV